MSTHRKSGVNPPLLGFPHYPEAVEHFGRNVLPVVRGLEAEAGRQEEIPDMTTSEQLANGLPRPTRYP